MGNLGWPQLLIIAVIIILLFGSKKLPDMARGLGQSLRILKAETKDLDKTDDASADQPAIKPQADVKQEQATPSDQAAQQKNESA